MVPRSLKDIWTHPKKPHACLHLRAGLRPATSVSTVTGSFRWRTVKKSSFCPAVSTSTRHKWRPRFAPTRRSATSPVVGVPVSEATEEVAAAIIMEDGSAPLTLEEVRAWAEKTIAHYALPRQLVIIAELPRNQMGKILRRKVAQLVRETLGRS